MGDAVRPVGGRTQRLISREVASAFLAETVTAPPSIRRSAPSCSLRSQSWSLYAGRRTAQAGPQKAASMGRDRGACLAGPCETGRPAANEPPRETRSVTVPFPLAVARQLEAAAKRSGASLSEFVRAAASAASRPQKVAPQLPSKPRRANRARQIEANTAHSAGLEPLWRRCEGV